MSAWNDFVKKIYQEGKKKDPAYQFKNAMQDASARKSEMGSAMAAGPTKASKSNKKRKTAKSKKGKGKKRKGTRKNKKY